MTISDKIQPKAILLDLDDTIVAFEVVAEESWRDVCKEFASQISELDAENLYLAIRETGDWYWGDPVRASKGRLNLERTRREVVMLTFEDLGIDNYLLANEIADSYSAKRDEAVFLFSGATDTLSELKNRGISLAMVTNGSSESQRSKIRRFRLAHFFNYILIEGEFGVGKPDERVFLYALEKLGVSV